MKKILLLLAAIMSLPMLVAAQSADNLKILGHYDSDNIATEGAAISTATGKVSVGTIMESDELAIFNGGKIVSFRVGLAESTPVTKVFVVPITPGGAYGTMVSWPCNVSNTGWNEVALSSPYQFNLTDGARLMIGFEYEQTKDNAPLSLVAEGDPYDTYWYKKAGQMYRWTTAGLKSRGNLSVQCVVEKDHYPDVLIKTSNLQCPPFCKRGEAMPFTFNVLNRGNEPLAADALTFDINVDGDKVGTAHNAEAIEPGAMIVLQCSLVTDELASGNHTLTINNAVAGEESLDYVFPLNATFLLHSGAYERQKHLVEQFTSTYCQYCPLGVDFLSLATQLRDDIVWVGMHGNLGTGVDPFTTAQGDSVMAYMNSSSYPSAAFDRSTGWESDRQMINSIGYYEEYHQEMAEQLSMFFDYVAAQHPTFATISIDPVVDLATREAVITVKGDMSADFDVLLGDDNKLYVYLTEDSLVARQTNGSTWLTKFVHNGVFRTALGSIKGVDFNKTDAGYCNEFTVTIPNEWNINNMNVVAFIGRPIESGVATDMSVNNAESTRLVAGTGGVEELLLDEDAVPVEYYDLMGRQHDGLQQGINIVKMSNGTARKVLVK